MQNRQHIENQPRRLVRDRRTGKLIPAPPQGEKDQPWYAQSKFDEKIGVVRRNGDYNLERTITPRDPTDEERMDRMKKVRETMDIPTPKRDLDRIKEIEALRRKKREDSAPRVFPPRKPEMPKLPVDIPRP